MWAHDERGALPTEEPSYAVTIETSFDDPASSRIHHITGRGAGARRCRHRLERGRQCPGGQRRWQQAQAPEFRDQKGDAQLHLATLYDCSGCSRGGHCPSVCATAKRPSQPSPGNRNTHGCACLHNETSRPVNFRYHWSTRDWKQVNMRPGFQYVFCWRYADGSHSSPDLQFELDVDMTKGNAWTTYNIGRSQTLGETCNVVPTNAHYTVKYRPNSANQFIAVYKGRP